MREYIHYTPEQISSTQTQTDSGYWDEEKRIAFATGVEAADEILITYEQSKDPF